MAPSSEDHGGLCDLGRTGVDVDAPERSHDVGRCLVGLNACMPPRRLKNVVRAEQEVTRPAGRVERAHLAKIDRLRTALGDLDQQRQLIGERRKRGGEVCTEPVLHEKLDDVRGREELVPNCQLPRVAREPTTHASPFVPRPS